MKLLIVGGSGFIGQNLCKHFVKNNIKIDVLTRSLNNKKSPDNLVNFINELNPAGSDYDVIINLSGEPLNKNRWNDKVKQNIYNSRIQTTQKLINFIANSPIKPKLLISGSAIGFYGNHPTQIFTEESQAADDGFTHKLCNDWEGIAKQAAQYCVRVCLIRTGIVLGSEGVALKEMLPPFKLGLGSCLGNGAQWMSWIHIDDVVGAIEFLIKNEQLNGAFNLTSPGAVTNQIFSKGLAASLNRPCFFSMPNFMVKMMFGEMGEILLLQGQNVVPDKLLKAGYEFKFPNLSDALKNILKK